MWNEASYYLKMAAGLTRYQLSPKPVDPIAPVREQMRVREERFLQLARVVLDQPGHVYRKLFDAAGCSYADLDGAVRADGLRATLTRLMAAGVYITHEEFTGRADMVRHGRHIVWHPKELDNPGGRGINVQSTSGSTGRSMTTAVSNAFLIYREGHEAIEARMWGLRQRARVVVGATFPSSWPLRRQVTLGRLDVPIDVWFAPAGSGWRYQVLTNTMVTQLRLLGAPTRFPVTLPHNDFVPVAEALARFRAEGRPAFVRTTMSMATRTASAARAGGLDIAGTVFSMSGEALTPSKRAVIHGVGACAAPAYGASEFGWFGFACPKMTDGDTVHLLEDANLLVSHRLSDRDWESIFVTSQLPCAPRILINVGVDDCATIEPSSCDCEYQRFGFTMQARNIVSYGKVTSQGVSIAAADIVALIEVDVPARFGGAPGDYQLAEVEGESQSELLLRISPRARVSNPDEVRDFVLARLGSIRGGSLSRRLWDFSEGLRVAFEEPEMTRVGKVHPLMLRRG